MRPVDPRLPGGGGYRVTGLNTGASAQSATGPQVQTFMEERSSTWHGIDTNFVWRGPGGLRLNGGTSSGYSNLNTCYAALDGPDTRGRNGDYRGGCDSVSPWNTRINGTVAYVIPWIDVLASGVFQGFRGVARSANVQDVHKSQVTWEPGSLSRLNDPCTGTVAVEGRGCFGVDRNAATQDINVLMSNELFGERITLFDLKLAKNIRFKNRRVTVGADIFNVFNSDAITGYNNDYILPENLAAGRGESVGHADGPGEPPVRPVFTAVELLKAKDAAEANPITPARFPNCAGAGRGQARRRLAWVRARRGRALEGSGGRCCASRRANRFAAIRSLRRCDRTGQPASGVDADVRNNPSINSSIRSRFLKRHRQPSRG